MALSPSSDLFKRVESNDEEVDHSVFGKRQPFQILPGWKPEEFPHYSHALETEVFHNTGNSVASRGSIDIGPKINGIPGTPLSHATSMEVIRRSMGELPNNEHIEPNEELSAANIKRSADKPLEAQNHNDKSGQEQRERSLPALPSSKGNGLQGNHFGDPGPTPMAMNPYGINEVMRRVANQAEGYTGVNDVMKAANAVHKDTRDNAALGKSLFSGGIALAMKPANSVYLDTHDGNFHGIVYHEPINTGDTTITHKRQDTSSKSQFADVHRIEDVDHELGGNLDDYVHVLEEYPSHVKRQLSGALATAHEYRLALFGKSETQEDETPVSLESQAIDALNKIKFTILNARQMKRQALVLEPKISGAAPKVMGEAGAVYATDPFAADSLRSVFAQGLASIAHNAEAYNEDKKKEGRASIGIPTVTFQSEKRSDPQTDSSHVALAQSLDSDVEDTEEELGSAWASITPYHHEKRFDFPRDGVDLEAHAMPTADSLYSVSEFQNYDTGAKLANDIIKGITNLATTVTSYQHEKRSDNYPGLEDEVYTSWNDASKAVDDFKQAAAVITSHQHEKRFDPSEGGIRFADAHEIVNNVFPHVLDNENEQAAKAGLYALLAAFATKSYSRRRGITGDLPADNQLDRSTDGVRVAWQYERKPSVFPIADTSMNWDPLVGSFRKEKARRETETAPFDNQDSAVEKRVDVSTSGVHLAEAHENAASVFPVLNAPKIVCFGGIIGCQPINNDNPVPNFKWIPRGSRRSSDTSSSGTSAEKRWNPKDNGIRIAEGHWTAPSVYPVVGGGQYDDSEKQGDSDAVASGTGSGRGSDNVANFKRSDSLLSPVDTADIPVEKRLDPGDRAESHWTAPALFPVVEEEHVAYTPSQVGTGWVPFSAGGGRGFVNTIAKQPSSRLTRRYTEESTSPADTADLPVEKRSDIFNPAVRIAEVHWNEHSVFPTTGGSHGGQHNTFPPAHGSYIGPGEQNVASNKRSRSIATPANEKRIDEARFDRLAFAHNSAGPVFIPDNGDVETAQSLSEAAGGPSRRRHENPTTPEKRWSILDNKIRIAYSHGSVGNVFPHVLDGGADVQGTAGSLGQGSGPIRRDTITPAFPDNDESGEPFVDQEIAPYVDQEDVHEVRTVRRCVDRTTHEHSFNPGRGVVGWCTADAHGLEYYLYGGKDKERVSRREEGVERRMRRGWREM
jgi:hypothetical protein